MIIIRSTFSFFIFFFADQSGEVTHMPIWGFWLKQIATPIIVIIGVIGNLLSMYLMRPRRRGNKSYRQYLFSLALFDTLTLIERQVGDIPLLTFTYLSFYSLIGMSYI